MKIRDKMIQKMENAIEAFGHAKKFERKQAGTDAVLRAVNAALEAVDESRDHLELSEEVGRIFFTTLYMRIWCQHVLLELEFTSKMQLHKDGRQDQAGQQVTRYRCAPSRCSHDSRA